MSIVPYNSNNEIVYHDPTLSVMVIHNNQENTIQLVLSGSGSDRYSHLYNAQNNDNSDVDRCPNCGIVLAEFQDKRGEFKRLTSSSLIPRRRGSDTRFDSRFPESSRFAETRLDRRLDRLPDSRLDDRLPAEIKALVPSGFMHQNYFKLLGNLNFEPNVIGLLETDTLPSDIFNQGYFDRFFRKVPPGILGSGAHAQVYKVIHMLKNIQLGVYAVKRINVGDHSHFLDQVLNEVVILYELSAEGANENNLIRYNHVWMEMGDLKDLNTIYLNKDGNVSTENERIPYVFILQQYCDGGHLENLIVDNFQREQFMSPKERVEMERQRRRSQKLHQNDPQSLPSKKWLSDFEVWKFFRDISNGVNYLHSKGILHRDLKPSNCLLESKYLFEADSPGTFRNIAELEDMVHRLPRVLVSDFGEGKFIDKQHLADVTLQVDDERRGNTGTIEFTDPKLWVYARYEGSGHERKFAYEFTKVSDIYSLGIILCYLCVGELPFAGHITDRTDPEKIRGDIARWHDRLSLENFHTWFEEKYVQVRGTSSECMEDFEFLIYHMVKADEDKELLTSNAIMEYLESMKWSAFIREGRKLSEATITEMPKRSDDNESEIEDDTIDLRETQNFVSEPRNQPSKLYEMLLPKNTRNVVIVSAYISNLAILERLVPVQEYQLVTAAKVFNLLGLCSEVFTGGSLWQNYVGVLCVVVTHYVVYLFWV
ncbi:CIC11C00000005633 [Sungouiella intermedia]|uniref:CIC11C00000005633 n=1 Tax=Sungouiella intermedia TaxID=45354 RepID=A0A1L0DC72_9ASCO|nr:CIC11C00000005633 [[Candida] intermedia]